MPEGDTVWRTARTLHAALASRTVIAFDSPLAEVTAAARRLDVVGVAVDSVEAIGKHLLVRFASGAVLHTHQGMRGSWQLYRRQGGRPRPRGHPRVTLETENAVALCLRSPVVELLSARELARHPALRRLGPDVLKATFDPHAALARLRERGRDEIGVALRDQTALAGLGNVYKSEVLFLGGVSPFALVGDLDDATLTTLIRTARDLMRRNLGAGPRRTTPSATPATVWVYRRSGRPCHRCGAPIRRTVQGDAARSTYFCLACQGGRPSG